MHTILPAERRRADMKTPFSSRRMQPLFVRGHSITLRLLFLVLISIILMTIDQRSRYLDQVRAALSVVVYPVQYLVNLPAATGKWFAENLVGQDSLTKSNARLREHNLFLKLQLQKFSAVKNENKRLRELLRSSVKLGERVLVAELLAVDMDPFRHQITLNKGSRDGVQIGQPLLDANGVMGQILQVGLLTSTALLISDPSHALPVQITRNGLRALVVGTGAFHRLEVPYIPKTADVRVGDLLMTSGLGGRFPPDYPVAKIISVEHHPNEAFANISAEPSAHLDRSREVLLLWPEPPKTTQAAAPAAPAPKPASDAATQSPAETVPPAPTAAAPPVQGVSP